MNSIDLIKVGLRGNGSFSSNEEHTTDIESLVSELRRYLGTLDINTGNKVEMQKAIVNWVSMTQPDTNLSTAQLVDKLTDEICNYGILTQAMQDPDVFEVRCNGRELKVEKNGVIQDYKDPDGNILFFKTVEDQEVVMRKLLGDVRLTPKDQLVSGRTVEGYRIAANHHTAMAEDPDNPNAPKFSSFVLRKFQKVKMGIDDIKAKGTMNDEMAKLLKLLTAGGMTFFTVGPTASGKTTTNNAILKSVPPTTRTVLAQNPSEIDIRQKNSNGLLTNDVLHLEAREIENALPTQATMENVMNQILRLSPTFVCFGEIRTDGEFQQAMKILQAGHPINATYHAEDVEGAIWRFVVAYMSASGNSNVQLALKQVCSLVNIIIVQKVMRDGTRKIIEIGEVTGSVGEQPTINLLYKFETDGNNEYDEEGNVKSIGGKHIRLNGLSQKTINKLMLEGVPYEDYSLFMPNNE